MSGQRRRLRGEFDDGQVSIDGGRPQSEEEDRQLFADIAGQEDHRGGRRGLVDRGPGQTEHQLAREAVTDLGVDRVSAEDALGDPGPGVGALVGETGATDHADRVFAIGQRRAQARRHDLERLVPGHGDERAVLADHWLGQAVLAVDGIGGKPSLVAQPAVVDRVDVDTEQTGEPVG